MPTTEFDPVDLLTGPRGRRLCLELAQRADDEVARRVFPAADDLDPGAVGTSRLVMLGPGVGSRPQPSPHEVADAISCAGLPTVDDHTLMRALDSAVATARYWQEPDGEDLLAATPTVRASLARVARAFVCAPAALWWTTALDATAQCHVSWVEDAHPSQPAEPGSRAALALWRVETVAEQQTAARERPTDPGRVTAPITFAKADHGGICWASTTRPLRTWLGIAGPASGGFRSSGEDGSEPVRDSASIDSTLREVGVMSVVTIRDLDPRVKAGLQRRAAEHGRSMEAEARAILAEAVLPPGEGLFTALQRTFAELGGAELELPSRTAARPPVEFSA